jgi:hypothetical protein
VVAWQLNAERVEAGGWGTVPHSGHPARYNPAWRAQWLLRYPIGAADRDAAVRFGQDQGRLTGSVTGAASGGPMGELPAPAGRLPADRPMIFYPRWLGWDR